MWNTENATFSLSVYVCLCINIGHVFANDGMQRNAGRRDVAIECGAMNVTKEIVELRCEIKNNTSEDIWVCAGSPPTVSPPVSQGDNAVVSMSEDYRALVVFRRGNGPRHEEIYSNLVGIPYDCLHPGQSRPERLSVHLPLDLALRTLYERGFPQALERAVDRVTQLAFEIGYYTTQDLRSLKDNAVPSERIEFSDFPNRVMIRAVPESQIWQVERVVRATIDGVSIPYREWLRCSPADARQLAPVQALRELFLSSCLTLEQYQSARDLLSVDRDLLGNLGRRLAEVYLQVAEGKRSPMELTQCLDQILGKGERENLLQDLRKKQVGADEKKQFRIAELAAAAERADRQGDGRKAIAALREILVMDSSNTMALELMRKIGAYYRGEVAMNSVGMRLAWIPPGEFLMGAKTQKGDIPQHRVMITRGSWMGVCEVTQKQYKDIMGSNPSHSLNDWKPVTRVTWYDAVEFCRKIGEKEGKTYRLPTEAEWEYACRAGSNADYWWGSTADAEPDGPNPFGLSSMNDNIGEWCEDWFCSTYYVESPEADPQGPSGPRGEPRRVVRGCRHVFPFLFRDDKNSPCPCYKRNSDKPETTSNFLSFRVVLEDDEKRGAARGHISN
jgi:formylglycine-generating enzyme required for sulfatase activity